MQVESRSVSTRPDWLTDWAGCGRLCGWAGRTRRLAEVVGFEADGSRRCPRGGRQGHPRLGRPVLSVAARRNPNQQQAGVASAGQFVDRCVVIRVRSRMATEPLFVGERPDCGRRPARCRVPTRRWRTRAPLGRPCRRRCWAQSLDWHPSRGMGQPSPMRDTCGRYRPAGSSHARIGRTSRYCTRCQPWLQRVARATTRNAPRPTVEASHRAKFGSLRTKGTFPCPRDDPLSAQRGARIESG